MFDPFGFPVDFSHPLREEEEKNPPPGHPIPGALPPPGIFSSLGIPSPRPGLPPRPPNRRAMFREFLSNFLFALGKGLQQPDQARAAGAAIMAPFELAERNQMLMRQRAQESLLQQQIEANVAAAQAQRAQAEAGLARIKAETLPAVSAAQVDLMQARAERIRNLTPAEKARLEAQAKSYPEMVEVRKEENRIRELNARIRAVILEAQKAQGEERLRLQKRGQDLLQDYRQAVLGLAEKSQALRERGVALAESREERQGILGEFLVDRATQFIDYDSPGALDEILSGFGLSQLPAETPAGKAAKVTKEKLRNLPSPPSPPPAHRPSGKPAPARSDVPTTVILTSPDGRVRSFIVGSTLEKQARAQGWK